LLKWSQKNRVPDELVDELMKMPEDGAGSGVVFPAPLELYRAKGVEGRVADHAVGEREHWYSSWYSR
jgi:hypothetical protein